MPSLLAKDMGRERPAAEAVAVSVVQGCWLVYVFGLCFCVCELIVVAAVFVVVVVVVVYVFTTWNSSRPQTNSS